MRAHYVTRIPWCGTTLLRDRQDHWPLRGRVLWSSFNDTWMVARSNAIVWEVSAATTARDLTHVIHALRKQRNKAFVTGVLI